LYRVGGLADNSKIPTDYNGPANMMVPVTDDAWRQRVNRLQEFLARHSYLLLTQKASKLLAQISVKA
jgi:hypothetical protein